MKRRSISFYLDFRFFERHFSERASTEPYIHVNALIEGFTRKG